MAIPEPWVFSIDRIKWQFGNCIFNILMLGVMRKGVAFSTVWCLVEKRGNFNSAKRMQLSNQFLERFGEQSIACLTADQDFVSKAWFSYLLEDPSTPLHTRLSRIRFACLTRNKTFKALPILSPILFSVYAIHLHGGSYDS